jgi:hypothetical protein
MIKESSNIHYSSHNDEFTMYYGRTNIIEPKDSIKLKNFISKIVNTTNKIDSTDIIYTSQLSDIPRFKLKEFINEKGIKRTSKVESSNCFILSKKLIQDFSIREDVFGKTSDIYFVSGELEDIILNTLRTRYTNNKYVKIPIKNEINTGEILYMSEHDFKTLPSSKRYNTYISKYISKKTYHISYVNHKTSELINTLLYLYDNPDVKVVFDEDLFSSLNKEGLQLDSDIENTLKDMIYSTDKANIKLGFEMISNLELNDHNLYKISLLLNNFINRGNDRQIRSHKSSINKLKTSNRNLRTLLNTLKSRDILWDKDWKSFVSGLVKNFSGTEHESLIKDYIIDKLNIEFNFIQGGLKIKDLKFAN